MYCDKWSDGNIQPSVAIALAMPSDTPSDTSFLWSKARRYPLIPHWPNISQDLTTMPSLFVPLPVRVKPIFPYPFSNFQDESEFQISNKKIAGIGKRHRKDQKPWNLRLATGFPSRIMFHQRNMYHLFIFRQLLICGYLSHRWISVLSFFQVALCQRPASGGRCSLHRETMRTCNALGCNNRPLGLVAVADALGAAGYRCGTHGGGCNVEGCTRSHWGFAVDDNYGPAGRRCYKHGGKTCSLPGCQCKPVRHVHIHLLGRSFRDSKVRHQSWFSGDHCEDRNVCIVLKGHQSTPSIRQFQLPSWVPPLQGPETVIFSFCQMY